MRIEVDPQTLIDAGKNVGALGTQLGALSDAMGQALSSGIASGGDPAGLSFGIKYSRQADDFGKLLAQITDAFNNVGVMLEATGFNYQHADQASVAGGAGPTGNVSGQPEKTAVPDAPYGPNGSLVTPPGKWYVIQPFIRMIPVIGIAAGVALTWPSGNSGMMNVTAAQWRNIARGLRVFEPALNASKASVGAQNIPEGADIANALSQIGSSATNLASAADEIATSVSDFANSVQQTQDAIRDLLNRISLDGLWDTVTGLLSGDGDKVLREIADDVSTVLENFQSQVKGVLGLLDELGTLLGEASDALNRWARPILVETFGEGAGNAIANVMDLYTDIQVGGAVAVIGLVSGTVALADLDTWKNLADTAIMIAKDPSKIDDVLIQSGSEFIALDEWKGENPGRGFGEAVGNIATLFIPGGALAKGGAVAKGLAATRNLLEKGELGRLGRLPGLGGRGTPDLPDLPDNPGAPHVPEFTPPPGVPPSVVNPPGGSPGSPNSSPSVRPQTGEPGGPSSTGSGPGAGNVPSPDGAAPHHDGAGPGTPSTGGPAPTGGSPTHGGGEGSGGSASGGPVPTGGSPSHGGSDGPSNGTHPSPPVSSPADSPGSDGPSKPGGGDGPGPVSGGDGSNSGSGDGPGGGSSGGSESGGDSSNGVGSGPNGDGSSADPGMSQSPGSAEGHPPTHGEHGPSGPGDDGRTYTMSDGSSHQTSFAPEQLGDNQRVSDALERNGVSRDDFIDLVNQPIDSLSPEERDLITAVRDDLPAPGIDTVMQKVIPPGEFDADGIFKPGGADNYLGGAYAPDGMRGAVTIADDTAHLGTPGMIHDGLRLDYDKSAFTPNDANAHVIRFQTDPASSGSYDVPRHSSMGGSGDYDGWGDPFTGNGFTKAGDDVVPEYGANDIRMREGAEMWEILDDGTQRLVAVLQLDADGNASWLRFAEPK
ncbi:hypothetical protein [Arthrobacter sp. SLBN-53]|uniref:WXG100-like domain-containing protein n=1 Tax=Arthrobacter sp. SLBN-53 TaxID=2768412 RepID=UPI0011510B8E|nr:hypothetical protein [Arthrobacter sp. SLBN-53]TQK29300.1 hypothetical protein FBY28_2300 [Arthrobacter sp. SLBN-53]